MRLWVVLPTYHQEEHRTVRVSVCEVQAWTEVHVLAVCTQAPHTAAPPVLGQLEVLDSVMLPDWPVGHARVRLSVLGTQVVTDLQVLLVVTQDP